MKLPHRRHFLHLAAGAAALRLGAAQDDEPDIWSTHARRLCNFSPSRVMSMAKAITDTATSPPKPKNSAFNSGY